MATSWSWSTTRPSSSGSSTTAAKTPSRSGSGPRRSSGGNGTGWSTSSCPTSSTVQSPSSTPSSNPCRRPRRAVEIPAQFAIQSTVGRGLRVEAAEFPDRGAPVDPVPVGGGARLHDEPVQVGPEVMAKVGHHNGKVRDFEQVNHDLDRQEPVLISGTDEFFDKVVGVFHNRAALGHVYDVGDIVRVTVAGEGI